MSNSSLNNIPRRIKGLTRSLLDPTEAKRVLERIALAENMVVSDETFGKITYSDTEIVIDLNLLVDRVFGPDSRTGGFGNNFGETKARINKALGQTILEKENTNSLVNDIFGHTANNSTESPLKGTDFTKYVVRYIWTRPDGWNAAPIGTFNMGQYDLGDPTNGQILPNIQKLTSFGTGVSTYNVWANQPSPNFFSDPPIGFVGLNQNGWSVYEYSVSAGAEFVKVYLQAFEDGSYTKILAFVDPGFPRQLSDFPTA